MLLLQCGDSVKVPSLQCGHSAHAAKPPPLKAGACFYYIACFYSLLAFISTIHAKLRVPFQFVPPVEAVRPAAATKPKPKAAPKQLSMTAFLKKN